MAPTRFGGRSKSSNRATRTGSRSPPPATFDGRGVWTIDQAGRFVDITYDWRLRAEKPLLRTLSFLLKPLFESNHRWAMAQGERSLRLELLRRRATSAASRDAIAPPPGPVTYSALAVLGGAAVAAVRSPT